MADVLVYATESRAHTARAVLGAACRATGLSARLELYGTGSLYQRLGPRRSRPLPDVVMWFGPFAARAAAVDGLLQAYQPTSVADAAAHDPDWMWTTLDYSAPGVLGASTVSGFQDLAGVPRLAMADPERSEMGMSLLLAVIDRSRQAEGDPERGWEWWQQRARTGLALAEDEATALAMIGQGGVSHAFGWSDTTEPLPGLAPLPHAIGLAASSRNVDAGRALLDWMVGPSAASTLRLSPWQAGSNGLQVLRAAAPPLDVDWARQQYAAARHRWADSAFGPAVES
jgi:ABC-type Fe3+ transport system substrate-binding protein